MLYTAAIDPSLYQFTGMVDADRKEVMNDGSTFFLDDLLIQKVALGLVEEAMKFVFNIFPVKRKRMRFIETRAAQHGELCDITF